MNRIAHFLPQYEDEIACLRRNPIQKVVVYPRFTEDGHPTKGQELPATAVDYVTLIYILSCWGRHVQRLADEELIKDNEENEEFVRRFFEEADKVADFSLLQAPFGNLKDCVLGYKRAKGLLKKV